MHAAEPPLHLVLGKPALGIARTKLAALQKDVDACEPTTLGADFPANPLASHAQ